MSFCKHENAHRIAPGFTLFNCPDCQKVVIKFEPETKTMKNEKKTMTDTSFRAAAEREQFENTAIANSLICFRCSEPILQFDPAGTDGYWFHTGCWREVQSEMVSDMAMDKEKPKKPTSNGFILDFAYCINCVFSLDRRNFRKPVPKNLKEEVFETVRAAHNTSHNLAMCPKEQLVVSYAHCLFEEGK